MAVETWEQSIHERLTGLMDAAVMLGIDAVFALLLAVIGIFGVMADLVGERTREIGVRLAMGAQRGNVLGLILRRATWLTGTGIAVGLVLAFILSHLVANLLRGVQSRRSGGLHRHHRNHCRSRARFQLDSRSPRRACRSHASAARRIKQENANGRSSAASRICSAAPTVDHDIDAELQAHIDLRIDANIAAGMSPRRRPSRRPAALRQSDHDKGARRLLQTQRSALAVLVATSAMRSRQLRRSPGFALTAILTLARALAQMSLCSACSMH